MVGGVSSTADDKSNGNLFVSASLRCPGSRMCTLEGKKGVEVRMTSSKHGAKVGHALILR